MGSSNQAILLAVAGIPGGAAPFRVATAAQTAATSHAVAATGALRKAAQVALIVQQ